MSEADEVVRFWREAGPARWFKKDDAFDAQFSDRFLALHQRAAAGQLDTWAGTPEGALALLILLDQFPRNVFRGSARMYATDAQARRIAREALARGFDGELPPELRRFMILPLQHSENAQDHELSVAKSTPVGGEALHWALHHQDIIRRFGRFPHRNAVLGRASTPEEERFAAEGGFQG